MVVRIEIDPGFDVGKIKRTDKLLAKRLGDWRPVWKRFNPELISQSVDAIKTKGGRINNIWPPLKRRTLFRKSWAGHGRAPLIGEGSMLKRLRRKTGYRRRLTRKMFIFGPKNSDIVANIHLGGTKKGSVPERSFLGWSRSTQAALDHIVSKRMDEVLADWTEGLG